LGRHNRRFRQKSDRAGRRRRCATAGRARVKFPGNTELRGSDSYEGFLLLSNRVRGREAQENGDRKASSQREKRVFPVRKAPCLGGGRRQARRKSRKFARAGKRNFLAIVWRDNPNSRHHFSGEVIRHERNRRKKGNLLMESPFVSLEEEASHA